MITSAEEFYRLRNSEIFEEYDQAYRDSAPESVWLDVIERYPEMRIRVARNKAVPLSILRILAKDEDTSVRSAVAARRKLDYDLLEHLSRDPDDGIRAQIVRHHKVTKDILQQLTGDNAGWVAQEAKEKRMRLLCTDPDA